MNKWLKLSLILGYTFLLNNTVFAAARNEQSLDHIVATVNKTVITQSELGVAIDKAKKQFAAMHTPIPPAPILHKQVLDQLINRTLQLDTAEQAGIHITDADVSKAIDTVAKKNRMTSEHLYAAVGQQGLSKTEYRKEIHDEIAIAHVQQQMMGGKMVISPQEVDAFMRSPAWISYSSKEYHLEDILVALPEKPTVKDMDDAKARVEALLTKLHQGVKFSEAAASSSDSKALQGGDLGWRKLPEIPSAFAGRLAQMKANDIAGPIQAPNGFHIIHVAGIRNVSMQGSKEDQRKQVQELLYQRKYEEASQNWITKLRRESYVNLHPES